MLSPVELAELKIILNDIDDADLFPLLDTVTKRLFNTAVREVAIERILSCTSKACELLMRQKVTKKVIFNYLVKKKVPELLPDWTKSHLVNICLNLWSSTDYCDEKNFPEVESEQQTEPPSVQTLHFGVEFLKWFFNILNSVDPCHTFGPEHFWPQVTLQAQLYTPFDCKELSISGANSVATFLTSLIIFDKYFFHANESTDSIAVEEEQHGLIKIVIKGILHQHSNCVGLFDSAFGLIKNPQANDNYKIQLVKLKMQSNTPRPEILPANNHVAICQMNY